MHPTVTASIRLDQLLGLRGEALASRIAEVLPDVGAAPCPPFSPPSLRGGRAAAVERLAGIEPLAYAQTRNHVAGAVTMLSPWIRHGVLSLAEVRDAALAKATRPEDALKLVSELGWRDYWRQVHDAIGDAILTDIEPPAATPRRQPVDRMPDDVLEARTGMACIDAFVRRLHDTGWLHNHERMWLASWLVHVRGVHWRAGADWFLRHLLDGDPASNHLSWQWIAGTFSAKPYLFNRENLETFTAGVHCRDCTLRGRCDVEGSYEALAERCFASASPSSRGPLRIPPRDAARAATPTPRRPLVWLTLDSAADTSPAAVAHPAAPRVFVIDPAWLRGERPSLKRLVFLVECLGDVPGLELLLGDPRLLLRERAAAHDCDAVCVAAGPCPRTNHVATDVAEAIPVIRVAERPFCDRSRVKDLGRFSRYWNAVSASAMRPTAG
jgi:deoxyribodipyrimidine photo-lyase